MKLLKRTVGPWALNAYVLLCSDTSESLLVDPGAEPDMLHQMLLGTRPKAIVVTHAHPDHIGALETMRTRLRVPVLAHRSGAGGRAPFSADQWIDDGEHISLGKQVLQVVHAPGHTDDQICLTALASSIVLVGDAIFEGGPGRTASAEDFRQTMKTLSETVLGWPDDTVCYPGHGKCFRLGDKRRSIERFVKKDHGAFYGDATWEM